MNSRMPGKLLITGASGYLGRTIGDKFHQEGWQVWALTRAPSAKSERRIHWDPENGELDSAAVDGFDAVVHLAGEPLVGIWTAAKKRSIIESRRQGTALLATALAAAKHKPSVLVSAGAIGFYGDRGDELLSEDSGNGEGFLAEVCEQWEAAAQPARDAGIRVVNLRIGLVLGRDGGMMERLLPVFRLGLGGKLGGGHQWWSWVAIEDVVAAAAFAVSADALDGPVNVVAPNPVTNEEFTKTLARAMHRPSLLAVPRFALRAVARQVADEMLLTSQRASSEVLEQSGYSFQFPELEGALKNILAAGGRRR